MTIKMYYENDKRHDAKKELKIVFKKKNYTLIYWGHKYYADIANKTEMCLDAGEKSIRSIFGTLPCCALGALHSPPPFF